MFHYILYNVSYMKIGAILPSHFIEIGSNYGIVFFLRPPDEFRDIVHQSEHYIICRSNECILGHTEKGCESVIEETCFQYRTDCHVELHHLLFLCSLLCPNTHTLPQTPNTEMLQILKYCFHQGTNSNHLMV